MSHMFYFFGLIIVLLNIVILSKFKRIFDLREWMVKFKSVTGRDPISEDYRKSDDRDILITWSVSVIITFLWIFFGLLSNSWYVYLLILIINALINITVKNIGEFTRMSFIITFIKSIIVILIITFLIINHFHLHLDLWEYLNLWLKN